MSWFKKVLQILGILAEAAPTYGPIIGADAKTQADLDKAAAAAKAAQGLGDKIDAVVNAPKE